jgi:hypothetical protein
VTHSATPKQVSLISAGELASHLLNPRKWVRRLAYCFGAALLLTAVGAVPDKKVSIPVLLALALTMFVLALRRWRKVKAPCIQPLRVPDALRRSKAAREQELYKKLTALLTDHLGIHVRGTSTMELPTPRPAAVSFYAELVSEWSAPLTDARALEFVTVVVNSALRSGLWSVTDAEHRSLLRRAPTLLAMVIGLVDVLSMGQELPSAAMSYDMRLRIASQLKGVELESVQPGLVDWVIEQIYLKEGFGCLLSERDVWERDLSGAPTQDVDNRH